MLSLLAVGLAHLTIQHEMVDEVFKNLPVHLPRLGSTGSRLLTGNLDHCEKLEKSLAIWHNREAALLVNSGYDANLSVLSSLTLNSFVLMDELCHNSLVSGIRLSKGCNVRNFKHNDMENLQLLLAEQSESDSKQPKLIVIESVYSMDGDRSPLNEIFEIALKYQACVIVDEAHGLGVFGDEGMGVLSELGLETHPALLCSIYTFGKAAGCHGAVILSSKRIIQYLFNYGRPIVYSTALPLHSLASIECAYKSMRGELGEKLREKVHHRVRLFRKLMTRVVSTAGGSVQLVPSVSPIQALVLPGNSLCIEFCRRISIKSNDQVVIFPIRSPTVPKGKERVRIIIHAHNTTDQISMLVDLIGSTVEELLLTARL